MSMHLPYKPNILRTYYDRHYDTTYYHYHHFCVCCINFRSAIPCNDVTMSPAAVGINVSVSIAADRQSLFYYLLFLLPCHVT